MKTWEISDANGNKHRVTPTQFRAELNARKAMAQSISDAFHRGDKAGVEHAQAAMRKQFPTG